MSAKTLKPSERGRPILAEQRPWTAVPRGVLAEFMQKKSAGVRRNQLNF